MPQKFVVQLSSQANVDYGNILVNLAGYYENPYSAFLMAEKIDKKIESLAFLPEGYSLVEDFISTKYKYRKVHISHYNIYYYVDNQNKIVEVVAIIDARQDPKKTQARLS